MGDINGHLSSFKVKNFKRFESFEMDNLGQFNLIVGDNNVGKTSLLEALLICHPGKRFINRLLVALNYRKLKPALYYSDLISYEHRSSNSNGVSEISFESIHVDGDKNSALVMLDKYDKKIAVSINAGDPYGFNFHDQAYIDNVTNTPFIPFFKGHDDDLTKFYIEIQRSKSAKASFIKSLKIIIPDIINIELSVESSTNYLIIYQEHIDATIPLAFFGDGALKVFRLLAEIIINKGGRLMIDEIDTGIHFSRFKDFWKTILLAAKQNNVQLFMTTHNEECIKYFKEVLENELKDLQRNTRLISLVENAESKQVTSHSFSFDQLEHAINMGNEIRA